MKCRRSWYSLFVLVIFVLFVGACKESSSRSPEYDCGRAVRNISNSYVSFSEERAERMFYRCLQAVEKRGALEYLTELDGGI